MLTVIRTGIGSRKRAFSGRFSDGVAENGTA